MLSVYIYPVIKKCFKNMYVSFKVTYNFRLHVLLTVRLKRYKNKKPQKKTLMTQISDSVY